MPPIIITGSAGFIGFHLAKKLLENGFEVVGVDNLNDYYDKDLKLSRNKYLENISEEKKVKYTLQKASLQDNFRLKQIFSKFRPKIVYNLAAQAGVRYSIENPKAYIDSNISGFSNILECCVEQNVQNLIYASSSSVYGGNKVTPFRETQGVDHPVSLYAATKRANELMAHTYSHLYKLPTTGLRFFTVYGPWGRPDMALFIFTEKILRNEPIQIFNNGNMRRDFTYIDDIIESLFRLKDKPAIENKSFDYFYPDPSSSWAPYMIFNIGNSNSVRLMDYIDQIEIATGEKAIKEFLPMQKGDVKETYSDTIRLEEWIGFKPNTSIKYGVNEFVSWYKNHYSK
tara:strand:+ start:508 stop:1533 length:1026 start_codon:yes stop_codon:yes gene_type:complete